MPHKTYDPTAIATVPATILRKRLGFFLFDFISLSNFARPRNETALLSSNFP